MLSLCYCVRPVYNILVFSINYELEFIFSIKKNVYQILLKKQMLLCFLHIPCTVNCQKKIKIKKGKMKSATMCK